jgi:hypothetical protein
MTMTQGTDTRAPALEALGNTLLGQERWNPDTRTLADQVGEILGRPSSARSDRAARRPPPSIDAVAAESSPQPSDVVVAFRERAADLPGVLGELRRRAACDPAVLALCDAWLLGATARADLMRLSGLSLVQYRWARRSLERLAAEVCAEVSHPRTPNQGE